MVTNRWGLMVALIAQSLTVAAQAPEPSYKLGMFRLENRTFIGLVLEDRVVADVAAAHAAIEKNSSAATVAIPATLTELIARADQPAVRERLAAIARAVAGATGARPPYVHDLSRLDVLPPVRPTVMLNAAVNYTEHEQEMAGRGGAAPAPAKVPDPIPGIWARRPGDTRQNPYLFLKPVSAIIGDGDHIVIPPGRPQIDWECELAVVIGRRASRVGVERANEYIFGYTLQNDVSDRGGRGDGRFGSDWLIGKGHDTFAPLGPFVVPKQFVKDPQKLAIKFTLSGQVMQDSNTARMTHTVYELVSYASHILTLQPGDVIATGSPAGVGTAREKPIYMKPGDVSVCSIESIGTLTNPVVGAGTGTDGR
jgi:2-keto-4-pentenoate hydratase/2-oxohepta-3-ene-1,7-dioic acid hydratase in catechol pathway